MEAVCERGDGACAARALSAALHALHLYCATISAALICCCAKPSQHRTPKRWRAQNVRGAASLVLGVAMILGAAASGLRPGRVVPLTAALLAPLAWLSAAALHVALWTRRSAASLLYLAIYWLLTAVSTAAIIWQQLETKLAPNQIEIYIHAVTLLMAIIIAGVDCVCFYDEVTKRFQNAQKSSSDILSDISYLHNDSHFYSKISFYWLNSLLYKGYESPLEEEDLGELPEDERSVTHYDKLKKIHDKHKKTKMESIPSSIWTCYIRMVWPNFYIAGVLKLFSDLIGVVPPLGLAVVIEYIQNTRQEYNLDAPVTVDEFLSNGYIMLLIMTLALISQGLLSQNSTHLVTVEGTRLKTALQGMVYDKCMRLAPWSAPDAAGEEAPLLSPSESSTHAGYLTNLVSQDTYNIMSCVWICHYTWAIPLKVAVILYLLYTKLGVSAIIGSASSILFITPLQFYLGKKIFDNSKDIGRCTDHRMTKLAEILQGMHVIKLYVWEDLFNEKILNLRELELKFLNKESIYWSSLTFTTQVSTIFVTMITFTVYYYLDDSNTFTAINIFTGLALFNQLSVPLLILPVTVLMVIQAMVSTNRIKRYLDLPESKNIQEEDNEAICQKKSRDTFNDAFVDVKPDDSLSENPVKDEADELSSDQFSDEDMFNVTENQQEILIRFRDAGFSWGPKNDIVLEVDSLDIPTGKLIMVVGASGSGKTSFLSCVLGEMYFERGEVYKSGNCSTWFAGQPPWLLEGSVRNNIVMDSAWCHSKYSRILRATGLVPDLQLLPEGDATQLGSQGSPLSGGQRVRVSVARALYSGARLLALDEPLGALDAALARHLVARALVPAARGGTSVLLATNRLELLHYADLIIVMEDGRVASFGRPTDNDTAISRWARLAGEARAAAARGGAGPPGGTARERTRLVRALSRARFSRSMSEDTTVGAGISEAAGAHLLAEVPTCAGGSWRRAAVRQRPALSRQFSSPPPSVHNYKWRRDVRRAVSADESSAGLRREASLLRRLLRRPRPHRTLGRWTPRTLRRLISSDSESAPEETQANVYCVVGLRPRVRRWGAVYWAAAAAAQGCAVAADCWLGYTAAGNAQEPLTEEQMWESVRTYALVCCAGLGCAGGAQAACALAGARARRTLHERLLHAALRQPPLQQAPGAALMRFGADIAVIDKKLPIAVSRWAQLALLCGAALLVNAVTAPWTLLALLPACLIYLGLQSVYLHNARELQRSEAYSAARVVSLAAQTCAGAGTVRAGRLQPRLRAAFLKRLDRNHNALLLHNSAIRWLGLTLDLVGAAAVCVSLGVALYGGSAVAAGLAGAYSLLLPAFLAHLAKCRADLDLQLAAVERVRAHTAVPQEDYREDCPIPSGWKRDGKIEFENMTVQGQEPGALPILHDINIVINPGQKVAICGRSGSGKSTLLLSCVGGTAITSGRVLIDGVDAMRVPLRTLRHRIVVLPQEAIMFSGTLRENLDPLAVHTDEEIWHSIRAVGLFDFVTSQPAGLECCVGKTRCGWSDGRAARVSAARALLHARLASALLLDEPGAALDAPAERALLASVASAVPDTTIMTVAHRVSSVRGYDRGVVLDAGRAAEQGALPALLARPGSRLAAMLAQPHA